MGLGIWFDWVFGLNSMLDSLPKGNKMLVIHGTRDTPINQFPLADCDEACALGAQVAATLDWYGCKVTKRTMV